MTPLCNTLDRLGAVWAIIVVSAAIAAESEPETRPDDRGARASRIFRCVLDRLHGNDGSDVRSPMAALGPTPGEGIWDPE